MYLLQQGLTVPSQGVPLPGSPAGPSLVFDLHVPAQLIVALGPDLLLGGGAMLLMLLAAWRPESEGLQRRVGQLSLWLVAVTFVTVLLYAFRPWTAGPGPIAVDEFRWASDLIFLAATFATIAMSIEYNARERIAAPESHVLVLFATLGMMLLAAARDLVLVFLGVELMSISVYVLTGLNRRSARSAEAALKYFLLGAFSTGFLLYGIALLYGATGSTNLSDIGTRINIHGLASTALVTVGVALLLVGFGFKVAAAPFHMWAPDVYDGAPTPITAYMAAAVKAAAFSAFVRVWLEALPDVASRWHDAMWFLAVLTMVVGNVVALAQRSIKRLLAYSSIAQAGYVLVAVVAGTADGASAFLFYLAAYTLATMGAFAVVVAIGREGEEDLSIDSYGGLWNPHPWLAAALAVCLLSLMGFPVFGGMGFIGKWYLIKAALKAQYLGVPTPQVTLAIVIVITSVVSAGYYLRLVTAMFMRPRGEESRAVATERPGPLTESVVFVSVVLLLAFGIFPQYLVNWSGRSPPVAVQQPYHYAPSSGLSSDP